MQLSRVKKNSTFLFVFTFFMLAIMMLATIPSTTLASADATTDPFQNTLTGVDMTVTAYTKTGTVTGTEKNDVAIVGAGGINQAIGCTSFNWKDVKYFKISLANLVSNLPDAVGGYEYSYEVTYFPAVVDGSTIHYDSASIITAPIYPIGTENDVAIAQEKTAIQDELYFFIDNNQPLYKDQVADKNIPMANAYDIFSNEQDYARQGGWGVYVFTFNCMDKSTSGSYSYELLPTNLSELKQSQVKLSVSAEKVSSSSSINDAYLFSVNEEYQYIDRKFITWKIKGTGSDGTKYVLVESDKTAENEETLYKEEKSITRTGPSFTLDTSIQGTWIAEVIIDDGTLVDGVAVNKCTQKSEEVSTIKPFSTQSIIWIVTGVTVVAVAIVAIIIIVTIKKEKTW